VTLCCVVLCSKEEKEVEVSSGEKKKMMRRGGLLYVRLIDCAQGVRVRVRVRVRPKVRVRVRVKKRQSLQELAGSLRISARCEQGQSQLPNLYSTLSSFDACYY
jgi:hypothetical protein